MYETNKKQYSLLAWCICGLGAIFYSYEYLLRISPSVMESALRAHYQLSAGQFGALSAFYYYAYVPMQIPVGILMDRYGPRNLLSLACLICAAGTYLFAISPWFWLAAIGRFMVGLGSAFAFVGVLKLATMWLPENKLAMVAGLAAALGTIGAMIGDNLLGWLVMHTSWQQTINYTALFGFALTAFLWLGLRDKRTPSPSPSNAHVKNNFTQSIHDLKTIATKRQIWLNGLYGSLVYIPTTVVAELWGIPYLHHAHKLPQPAADFGNSMIFLGFTFGAPLMGMLSDKLGRRILPMRLGAAGALIMSLILLYLPGLNQQSLYLVLFSLGLCYSAQAITFAVGRESSPRQAAGTAMAFTNMIVMLGGMFLQPIVGWVLDLSAHQRLSTNAISLANSSHLRNIYNASDFQLALSIMPLGAFIALVLTFFIKETYAHANR